jgi:hypothetical protein
MPADVVLVTLSVKYNEGRILMSDELRDIEAKLLTERLNLRTRLLAIATGEQKPRSSLRICLEVVVTVLMVFSLVKILPDELPGDFLLAGMIMLVLFAMTSQAQHFSKRIDALMEVLRQDGQLQGSPPPLAISSDKSTAPRPNQDGGRSAAPSRPTE